MIRWYGHNSVKLQTSSDLIDWQTIEETKGKSEFIRANGDFDQIIRIYDSKRYGDDVPVDKETYYRREDATECLMLAYSYFQLRELDSSKLFYETYQQLNKLQNTPRGNFRVLLYNRAFVDFLTSNLKYD